MSVECHAAPRLQLGCRVEQIEPHQGARIGVGPLLAVLGDERELTGDPIGLRVDERAVHVPQHCGRLGHRSSVPGNAADSQSSPAGRTHVTSRPIIGKLSFA